jgi:hypothetical protein
MSLSMPNVRRFKTAVSAIIQSRYLYALLTRSKKGIPLCSFQYFEQISGFDESCSAYVCLFSYNTALPLALTSRLYRSRLNAFVGLCNA